ncbi:MAG: HAD family phosphatase [Patescibacteria group bacterium]|mgnify:CR=1 FL=1
MLKAIIFDLDGLLVDSTPLQLEANRLFIESFGKIYAKPTSGREGMRIIDILRDYKDIFELPGSIEELYRKRQQIYFDLVKTDLRLFPDSLPLLEKLKKRGLRLALATSGDRNYVRLVFTKFPKLKDFFEKAVTSEEVDRGKPYPDVFLKAVQLLEIMPSEAVVIEDSFNGVAAAKRANIPVICIPNQHYPDADVGEADRVFKTLGEVEKALK